MSWWKKIGDLLSRLARSIKDAWIAKQEAKLVNQAEKAGFVPPVQIIGGRGANPHPASHDEGEE